MKIAILNDTHCGIRNSSEIFLNNAADFYSNVFFPECEKQGIQHILHLGDYYDHRKFVNFKALNHNRRVFLDQVRKRNMVMDIIPGNHDTFYKNTNELRYGKGIIIFTDQDYDGFHIKGLLMNFIHYFWLTY